MLPNKPKYGEVRFHCYPPTGNWPRHFRVHGLTVTKNDMLYAVHKDLSRQEKDNQLILHAAIYTVLYRLRSSLGDNTLMIEQAPVV